MIVYVISADHAYTIRDYLRDWVAPDERKFIQVIYYEEAPWRWLALPATYLFTDIERLTPGEVPILMEYAQRLRARRCRVLNAAGTVPRRLELQNRLFGEGINPFRLWPRAAFDQVRFPAFLRRANSHSGSIGDLLHNPGQLAERLRSLPESDRFADDLVLVEFFDTRDHQGRYHKYSAIRTGETLLPRHVFTSLNWMLKAPDILDAPALELERDYVRQFPHRDALGRIFTIAGIDFGRIDYSLQGGNIRVWEINTNPTLMPRKKALAESRREVIEETHRMFLQALRTLDDGRIVDSRLNAEWARVRARHRRAVLACFWKRKIFGKDRA